MLKVAVSIVYFDRIERIQDIFLAKYLNEDSSTINRTYMLFLFQTKSYHTKDKGYR